MKLIERLFVVVVACLLLVAIFPLVKVVSAMMAKLLIVVGLALLLIGYMVWRALACRRKP
jgi:hypothetical protein